MLMEVSVCVRVCVCTGTTVVANICIAGKYSVLGPVQSAFHLFNNLSKSITLGFYYNLHLKGEETKVQRD